MTIDPIEQFKTSMQERGLMPPAHILADGHIHRCGTQGKPHGDAGAYLLHLDGVVPAGGFQNHRDGSGWQKWRADIGRRITAEEAAALKSKWEQIAKKREAARQQRERFLISHAQKIWSEAAAIEGSPAETYLRARGIKSPFPKTLRYHPNLEYTRKDDAGKKLESWFFPGMVAAVTRHPDRSLRAIHRTFITHEGRKAPVNPVRRELGPVGGGAVRLAQANDRIAIAEGLETALSVQAATKLPTWAGLSAVGLEEIILPPLPLASSVLIAADNDESGTGMKAAKKAAERLMAEGRNVEIAMPQTVGTDWNDYYSRNSK